MVVEDGRREKVAEMRCYRRSQLADCFRVPQGCDLVGRVARLGEAATTAFAADAPKMKVTMDIPPEITTPDSVETSIGTLNFFDGAPDQETAEKVYDYLDTMRGVDVFLKGMPLASLAAMIDGLHELGAIEAHQVVFTDKLLDSTPLFLTGNTSTLYVSVDLDLKRDGPTVIEAPAGMLGAINDAAFHYVEDIGPVGPDKGKGGKYLILNPSRRIVTIPPAAPFRPCRER